MFTHLDQRQKLVFVGLFVNFAVLGMVMALFGAAIPQIIDAFHWNYVETGAVLAALSLGTLGSNFLGGMLLRRFEARWILAAGLLSACLGLVLFGQDSRWLTNAVLAFLMGLGQGCSEVITNSVVIRFEKPGESRLMNLMHASFCIGAVAGPLGVAILTQTGIAFSLAFLAAGLVQFAVLVMVLFLDLPRMHQERQQEAKPADPDTPGHHRTRDLLRHPLLLQFSLMLFLYVGVELAMSNWIAEYFARFRQSPTGIAALTVSIFWAGLLVGRLFLGFVYKGKNQARLLMLLAVASVMFFSATLLLPLAGLSMVAAFLTGLAFSGTYPVIMTLLGQVFEGSTAAVGMGATAGGIGLLVFPLATGGLAQTMGLDKALLVCVAFDLALALLAVWYQGRQSRRPASRATS